MSQRGTTTEFAGAPPRKAEGHNPRACKIERTCISTMKQNTKRACNILWILTSRMKYTLDETNNHNITQALLPYPRLSPAREKFPPPIAHCDDLIVGSGRVARWACSGASVCMI